MLIERFIKSENLSLDMRISRRAGFGILLGGYLAATVCTVLATRDYACRYNIGVKSVPQTALPDDASLEEIGRARIAAMNSASESYDRIMAADSTGRLLGQIVNGILELEEDSVSD